MEMRIGTLPDDDAYFNARAVVDWSFKFIAWLGVTATFQVAAEATNSWMLRSLYILCYLLILFYLQSLIDWLLQFRRHVAPSAKPKVVAPPVGRVRQMIWRGSQWFSLALSFVIVWSIKIGMQYPVQFAIDAIAKIQKH